MADPSRVHGPDARNRDEVAFWGYHQLHALASVALALEQPAYLQVAECTVERLVRPVLAGNFYYS